MTVPVSASPAAGRALDLRLHAIRYEARDIVSLEWRSADRDLLPPFSAGAHVDFQLGESLTRSYSLVNPQNERHRYVVAVKYDPASRGGSRFVHEQLRVGTVLRATPPRNHFQLQEDAPHSVLFAGGIGITPLWAMVQRLDHLGRSWDLHYSARSPDHAAFLDEILALERNGRGRVRCHFDTDRPVVVSDAVAGIAPDHHVYCCGPASLLDDFERACAARDPATVHLERFAPAQPPVAADAAGCSVILARSRRTILVASDQTILDALLEAGLDVPHACKQGICGSCETGVVDGMPDHRDSVLSAAERASNKTMMICCSRARSGSLVLDL